MAVTNRKVENITGFGRSDKTSVTIAAGQTTNAVSADLLRGYSFIVVSCANCANIQAGTKLRLEVADDSGVTPVSVWAVDGLAVWESGVLPTSGAFRFLVSAAIGAQLVKPTLTIAAGGGGSVVIDVVGFDPTIIGV